MGANHLTIEQAYSEKEALKKQDVIYVQGYRGKQALRLETIVSVVSKGGLSMLTLVNGKQHYSSYNLAHFEAQLPKELFFRAHKSAIINREYIESVAMGRTGTIKLANESTLPLSARRKQEFINWYS
jgi:two-component system LytT family response regulator